MPLTPAAQHLKQCQNCFKSESKERHLQSCSQCKRAHYCVRQRPPISGLYTGLTPLFSPRNAKRRTGRRTRRNVCRIKPLGRPSKLPLHFRALRLWESPMRSSRNSQRIGFRCGGALYLASYHPERSYMLARQPARSSQRQLFMLSRSSAYPSAA